MTDPRIPVVLKEHLLFLYGNEPAAAAELRVSRQAINQWAEMEPIPENHALKVVFILKADEVAAHPDEWRAIELLPLLKAEIESGTKKMKGTAHEEARERFGFRGDRDRVFDQMVEMVAEQRKNHAQARLAAPDATTADAA